MGLHENYGTIYIDGGKMNTVNFKKIQSEIRDWQDSNVKHLTNPFYGVVEEVGKLAHIILKANIQIKEFSPQSLLNNPYSIKKLISHKVADIVIFLIGFCILHDIDFEEEVEQRWKEVKDRNWIMYPENGTTK